MRAAVLLVGDELLAGHTRDANAHYIAQRMYALGHRLRRIGVVPDEVQAIRAELDVALTVADIVFVSGGLGPTHDDRTTEAMATRFGRRLVVDEASWQRIVERYAKRVEDTPQTREAARKMVTVPEGVEVLENPVGAAPGYILRSGEEAIVVLPGVPNELQAIYETSVVGKLVPSAPRATHLEIDVELAEAVFATALGEIAERFGDVEIGSYPHFGERRVTLRFKGEGARPAEAVEAFLEKCPDAKRRIVRRSA